MKADDYKESRQDTKSFIKNGECEFDLPKHGGRLQPISFVPCSCTEIEKKFTH